MIGLLHWIQALLAPTIIRIPAVKQWYLIPKKEEPIFQSPVTDFQS